MTDPTTRSALIVIALFAAPIVAVLALLPDGDPPAQPPARAAETAGEVRSESKSMGFDECLKSIRLLAESIGQAPINIVETDSVRMVRFISSDGSVLVTCSRPDQKQVITTAPGK
jgi:hypothetical protein